MNNRHSCIVTITDGISPTSMPFNEFVLFRLKHYPDEKQVLIQLFENGVDKNIRIPNEVEYYCLGMNLLMILKRIRDIETRYKVKAYHIHEGKSVILFSLATLLQYRQKTIYTLHSTYKNYPFHNKLFCFCASILARKIVCVSRTSYKYYPALLKKLCGRHAMYIQNGVDTNRIALSNSQNGCHNRSFTMVYVARLVPLKRHHILLETLRKLPNVSLKLIGIGPLESELKQRVSELGISRQVEFMGLLSREKVYQELKNADLYVSSSSYEGLPIGVLEAMCCGIPCLVSDIEQHQEIAEKCSSLSLCRDDVDEWTRNICEIESLSSETRSRIGRDNKRQVELHFSLTAMHEKYDVLYSLINA